MGGDDIVLSSKRRKMFEYARIEGKRSPMKSKHGCVIARGGKVITSGYNQYKINLPELIIRFSNKCDRKSCALHAEIHALFLLLQLNMYDIKKLQFRKYQLYVARASNKNDDFMNSKPCENCISILKDYQINKIFYSAGNNVFKMEKLCDIKSDHISLGHRYMRKLIR